MKALSAFEQAALQAEVASLRKQVAERDALLVEKDAAISQRLSADKYCAQYAHLPESEEARASACEEADGALKEALAKTLPSEALERALAAERKKVSFSIKEEFYAYKNHMSDELFIDTAIELIDSGAKLVNE